MDRDKPTTVKTRMIAHNQQVLRVDSESTRAARPSLSNILKAKVLGRKSDLIILQDYQKGALTTDFCRAIMAQSNIPVFVGLKTDEIAKYKGATCVSLNRGELLSVTHKDSVEAGAKKLIRDLGLGFIVVTLGEQGIMVSTREGKTFRHASEAREVFDVTGAGDTVLAAFAIAYASGIGLADCAKLANMAAGIVVGKIGTAVVSRLELYGLAGNRKVIESVELANIASSIRASGRRIVFTNGVFDIFHDGHANLLAFAKSQGDVLIVGVNSDRSVRKIKGEKRPIIPQEKRVAVLAAMQFCDYVVTFDEETPEKLVQKLKPDIIVKGADWKGKEVVGSDHAKVVFAPLVKGSSTTEIIRRILGLHKN
jgi:D-beta-D-heptose 7-phosphate kinase/D-beta-D-heptose 1-phosphate adenosyltransferase